MTVVPLTGRPAALGGVPAFPQRLPLALPPVCGSDALIERIRRILDGRVLTNGPAVRELEEAVAVRLGVPHVVAVSSCTAGLMLVLQGCAARGPVVLPGFTFSATAHAVHWAGGTPRFADADPSTLTLDPGDAGRRISGAVALVATHVYGTPCDIEHLETVADAARVPLVFDAAHALGSRRDGAPVGRFGTAEVFSLSPTKCVTGGEGGLITTHDAALAEHCRIGRDYGNPGDYDCVFAGLNARMSELHAAVALASLAGLDERVARRGALAARLRAQVRDVPGVSLPHVAPADTSTFKDLTILVDAGSFGLSTAQLQRALDAEGVETRRYYDPPVHRQRAYAGSPLPDLPVTDRAAAQVLTLPLHAGVTDADVDRLVETLARIQAASAHLRMVLA